MQRSRIAALGLLAGALLMPAPAQAQDVFVDPDSPSGKEYAIPLESARRGADPGRRHGTKVVQGQRSSPLFGAGISAAAGDDDGSSGPTSSSRGKRDEDRRNAAPVTAVARPASPAVREALRSATSRPSAPDGGSSAPLVGGAAALLVAAAAGAGWLARRRRA